MQAPAQGPSPGHYTRFQVVAPGFGPPDKEWNTGPSMALLAQGYTATAMAPPRLNLPRPKLPDGELELDLDKDSDFGQHSQYQPDHAGSFPFQCYCGHEFQAQKNYRLHILENQCVHWHDIKIHGNIIVCTCGVEFAQRGSLFRHLRTRQCRAYWPDGGRALVCLCGAKFNRRDNMVRHQKSPRCRQNCARLGVTGNPRDSIPPIRKNKHKKYRPSDALYFEKMAFSAVDGGDDEAVVNRRWYEQFGAQKDEPKNPGLLKECAVQLNDHERHNSPYHASSRPSSTVSSQGESVGDARRQSEATGSHEAPPGQVSQPNTVENPSGSTSPGTPGTSGTTTPQPGAKPQSSTASDEAPPANAESQVNQQQQQQQQQSSERPSEHSSVPVSRRSSGGSTALNSTATNSPAMPVTNTRPPIITTSVPVPAAMPFRPQQYAGQPPYHTQMNSIQPPMAMIPQVQMQGPVPSRTGSASVYSNGNGNVNISNNNNSNSGGGENNNNGTTGPPPVQPINLGSSQPAHEPSSSPSSSTPDPLGNLNKALDTLYDRITRILAFYQGVASYDSIAATIIDTFRSIVRGFTNENNTIPKDRAALLCETMSTGMSQILLAKLLGVSNKTFVQIVHQIDNVVFDELSAPLKELVD